MTALQLIKQTLNPSDPARISSELVSISYVKKYQKFTDANLDKMRRNRILGWSGMGLVVLLFFTAVWWFFIRGGKQGDTGTSKQVQRRNFWTPRRLEPYEREKHSIKYIYEDPDAAYFGRGNDLLATDGRAVYSDNAGYRDDDEDEDDESSVSATAASLI